MTRAYTISVERELHREKQGGRQMGAAAYQVWRFIGTTCLEFLLIIFSYGTFSKKANVVLVFQLSV